MNNKEIILLAKRARKDFEKGNIDYHELGRLYQDYNPVKDMGSFLNKAIELFPKLNCGLVSVYLHARIPESRIVKGKFGRNNHTFLIFPNQKICDITADQYGGPKVYVGNIKSPWSI
jgi:hypothetical protein